MPRFVIETVWDAEHLAAHCNDEDGGCPVLGSGDVPDWPAFHCPFVGNKNCTDITPADWQALEVNDGD